MNREEKLHIAREACKAMKTIVDNLELYLDADIDCCWNRCIRVGDILFHEDELNESYANSIQFKKEKTMDELVKLSQEMGGYDQA